MLDLLRGGPMSTLMGSCGGQPDHGVVRVLIAEDQDLAREGTAPWRRTWC